MPFFLPSGETIRIDYFNVIKGGSIVAEYLEDGVMLVRQTMPKESASIFASVLSEGISGIYSTAPNEQFTFEITLNEPYTIISTDSFTTKVGSTHVEIDYLFSNAIVLSQRTSIKTIQAIADEIIEK